MSRRVVNGIALDVFEKRCLMIVLDEFKELVRSLYDEEVYFDIGMDGMSISTEEDIIQDADLHSRLAKALGVDGITSIHLDDYEIDTGVWLVCRST